LEGFKDGRYGNGGPMSAESNELHLKGCAPVPLAYYLKALGIFRLVAEQVEPSIKGYWIGDSFRLRTEMDRESLRTFFLEKYRPTPIVAPWNGGSGFYFLEEKLKEKDPLTGKKKKTGRRIQPTAATKAVQEIMESTDRRFLDYRKSLLIIKSLVKKMGLEEAPSKEKKEELIQTVRNCLPDCAINWLDASVILTTESARFPPLLGTGGNDGNLDFSSNFMQRLIDVFGLNDKNTGSSSGAWLDGALFAENSDGLVSGISIGQFYPGAVGGPNSSPGFVSDSPVNPWDYILMIEGALFFASATVKRLQANLPGVLSYPFSVRPSGVGYGSASDSDEKSARAEIWVPLWENPTGLPELKALMSEGRAQVGTRPARNGIDFARAVASLGVDRGLKSFQRYGFLERNGKNFFSVPLERIVVSRQIQVELLNDVDSWLDSFHGQARSEKAPASVGRALHVLESSILALCKESSNDQVQAWRVQDVLIALGGCEKAIVRSSRWAKEAFVKPVSYLSKNWLTMANDQSPEFFLAASLASTFGRYKDQEGREFTMWLRSQMEPINHWNSNSFDETLEKDVVWSEGDPISVMNDMMARRVMMAIRSGADRYPDDSKIKVDLGDIAAFIEGRVNLNRMMDLLCGLILVDWPSMPRNFIRRQFKSDSILPSASYALLKLCFAGGYVCNEKIPLVLQIHRRAAVGDGLGSLQLAERRLRGSNLPVARIGTSISSNLIKRIAAALLFSIKDSQIEHLAGSILRPRAVHE
jgi:CRISPR-associated protein Csx17